MTGFIKPQVKDDSKILHAAIKELQNKIPNKPNRYTVKVNLSMIPYTNN